LRARRPLQATRNGRSSQPSSLPSQTDVQTGPMNSLVERIAPAIRDAEVITTASSVVT
jgi:hypothetical protein